MFGYRSANRRARNDKLAKAWASPKMNADANRERSNVKRRPNDKNSNVPNVVTPGARKKTVIDGVMRLGLGVKREMVERVYPLAQYIYERGPDERVARALAYATVGIMQAYFGTLNRVAQPIEKVLDSIPLTANWRMVNSKPMWRLHRAMINAGIVAPRRPVRQLNNYYNKVRPRLGPISLFSGETVLQLPASVVYTVVKPGIFAESALISLYAVVFVMRLIDALTLQKRSLVNASKNMAVANLKRAERAFKKAADLVVFLIKLQAAIYTILGPVAVKSITGATTSALKMMLKVKGSNDAIKLLFHPANTLTLPST